jgi:hypothetical protein
MGADAAPAPRARKDLREIKDMVTGSFATPPHYPQKLRLCNGSQIARGHRRVSGMNPAATPFDKTQ